jgi:hypothetical protein
MSGIFEDASTRHAKNGKFAPGDFPKRLRIPFEISESELGVFVARVDPEHFKNT